MPADLNLLTKQLVTAGILQRGELQTVSASVHRCYQNAAEILQQKMLDPVPAGGQSPTLSPLVASLLECNGIDRPTKAPAGNTLPMEDVLGACLVLCNIPADEARQIVSGLRTQYPCTDKTSTCLRLPNNMQEWVLSLDDDSQCLMAAFLVWEANHVRRWNPDLALYQQAQGGSSAVDLQHPPKSWAARHWWIWFIVGVVGFILLAALCIHYGRKRSGGTSSGGPQRPRPLSHHHRSLLHRSRRYPYSGRRIGGRSTLLVEPPAEYKPTSI